MLAYVEVPSFKSHGPRIGVPWRTYIEEQHGRRGAYERYLRAVRKAGGEPVEISLALADAELTRMTKSLDGFILPGSPADVEPRRFGATGHPRNAHSDKRREHTDGALLEHALTAVKPVLAICYGAQLLNVHLHGTLVQDIPSEVQDVMDHDGGEARSESLHPVRIERGSLAELAGRPAVRVNSSHHQAVRTPGRGLRVTARGTDGVIEAVEWTGPGWVVGVQWHPERMPGDAFAGALFRRLVEEAQDAAKAPKPENRRAPRQRRRSKPSR